MIKIIALVSARPGMKRDDFIRRYEEGHVPLVLRHFPMLSLYKRNYVLPAQPAGVAVLPDFDAQTELGFQTPADLEAFRQKMQAVAVEIAQDEEQFLDRSRTRLTFVDERISKAGTNGATGSDS